MEDVIWENWNMKDAVLFTLLCKIYERCDKVETSHYPSSTVLSFGINGNTITFTVPDKVLGAVKDKIEEKG